MVTNGGRILNVTGVADDLADARAAAYAGADLIAWEGVRRREDIALAASVAFLQDLESASADPLIARKIPKGAGPPA